MEEKCRIEKRRSAGIVGNGERKEVVNQYKLRELFL